MKYLYIVEHWIPSSEYGGVHVVLADSQEECEQILTDDTGSYHEKYNHLIPDAVKNAEVFEVNSERTSTIVNQFIT